MFDWQSIAVALIILAACAYVGWRALARLRSFRSAGAAAAASCATGCGSCGGGGGDEVSPRPVTKAPPLVQISPSRVTSHRRAR